MTETVLAAEEAVPRSTSGTTKHGVRAVRHDLQRRHHHRHARSPRSSSSRWRSSWSQGHLDRGARRRAAVLRGHHHPDAPADRGRDRHEDRAVRAAAGGHDLRVHPGRPTGWRCCRCSTAVPTAPRASCSSRPPRTSTSCWRSRCSCSSATTPPASGVAAPSGHPKKVVKGHVALAGADQHRRGDSPSRSRWHCDFSATSSPAASWSALIAMFPWYIQWAPNAIWKTFDLFVGLIQAFIFALLTILYFSQSMELDHDDALRRALRPQQDLHDPYDQKSWWHRHQLSRRKKEWNRSKRHHHGRCADRRWIDHGWRRHRRRHR